MKRITIVVPLLLALACVLLAQERWSVFHDTGYGVSVSFGTAPEKTCTWKFRNDGVKTLKSMTFLVLSVR
jgi:hypothetical protein